MEGRAAGAATAAEGAGVAIPRLGRGLDPALLRIVTGPSAGPEARFRAPRAGRTGGARGAEVLDAAEEAARAAGAVSLVVCTGPGRSPDEAECRERGYRFGHLLVGKPLG
ncbi:hypothetical protein [Streptomyces calidiresistens]|uniref:Uncharacterized protein n=1 Tax=Streptomyces calidiresistens TaxID=1485586 RepID=A0A7W3T920_9ACTN|nr:hypothetical protein [Streptomyces calidiresistens]MBB0233148.1 hypothetical protein [Streptomyces calidiresistens]